MAFEFAVGLTRTTASDSSKDEGDFGNSWKRSDWKNWQLNEATVPSYQKRDITYFPGCPSSFGSLAERHLTHGSLGPRKSAPSPKRISIGLAVFAGITRVLNRHTHVHADTDKQTLLRVTSVAIGRIYAMHAMLPKIQEHSFVHCWASSHAIC